jgi:hypothetical protein
LQLAVGEHVEVGERDTEWPEFVTAYYGSGWVPARHLSASSGTAVVQRPYDTTELPTKHGDVLDVLAEDLASGWLWCRGPEGGEGWVPAKTVEISAEQAAIDRSARVPQADRCAGCLPRQR